MGVEVGQVRLEQLDDLGGVRFGGWFVGPGGPVVSVGADGGVLSVGGEIGRSRGGQYAWPRSQRTAPVSNESAGPDGDGAIPVGSGCAEALRGDGGAAPVAVRSGEAHAPFRRRRSASASLSTKKSPLSSSTPRRTLARLADADRDSDANAAVEPAPSAAKDCTARGS